MYSSTSSREGDLQHRLPAPGAGRTEPLGRVLEIPRVRKDLGYPPLVTPTSQIVGTQAVLNVLVNGERYRNVTKEVKDYVRGLYGKSPAPVTDEIRTLIIGDEDVITVRPADLLEPAYEKMKEEAISAGLVGKRRISSPTSFTRR